MSHKGRVMEEIYRFVRDYLDENGYAPSYREIAAALYLSPSLVQYYIDRLVKEKRLQRDRGRARSLRVSCD